MQNEPPLRNRTRVIGYVRVSTEDQAEGGVSLAAQRRRVEAYAAAHDLDLVAVEADEGLSAKRLANRPALQRALERLRRREADGLVAVKLDRLSRTTRDVLDLVARAEREGWALHSIEERLDTSSPHGRFVVTVLAALAQMEREQIGARTRSAMAELRRQGRRASRFAPFGHRFTDGLVVPDEGEQLILARMVAMAAEGLGPRRIANTLNRAGLANPRTGRVWHYGSVRAILARRGRGTCDSAGCA